MKKILFAIGILVLGSNFSFAQRDNQTSLITQTINFDNGEVKKYFTVQTEDHDLFIKQFVNSLKEPAKKEKFGKFSWNDVAIDGVGEHLTILVEDGMFVSDMENKSACYTPFETEKSKMQSISNQKENDFRIINIYVMDKQGKHLVNDPALEPLLIKYILSKV